MEQNDSAPGSHVFQQIKLILQSILVEFHPRTICAKLFQIGPVLFDKEIFYVFTIYTWEKLTPPLGCLQIYFNNLGRGSVTQGPLVTNNFQIGPEVFYT